MKSSEIRNKFLEFFKLKDHQIVPSDSLIPRNDPTLLFTSAGMNQFKEQFLGRNITHRRAVSCQKCLRTQDLDKVGKTSGHHTFFEMLGNFSFGDYFKKEACTWAWEFMTEVLKLPSKRLWISIYKDDVEAYQVWKDIIKVPLEKIVKLGAKENFWPSNAPTEGPNGPCGPCSEIFYDWGKSEGCGKKNCNPSCDCGRFVEVWNLVFTQFDRVGKNKLAPLPSKNIDTGMGLERISAVMQAVKTNFETDLFKPIIEEVKSQKSKVKTEDLNTIADHIRAATFAIGDGISPSNEERGYVVRKLIRRAYLLSKANKPFLYNLVPTIARLMEEAYPELKSMREEIAGVIKEEEEKFQQTLSTALPRLEDEIRESRKKRELSGDRIFKLVDTYGLPLEVIEERARRAGYKLDITGFEQRMKKQKILSKVKSKIEQSIFVKDIFSAFEDQIFSKEDPLHTKIIGIKKEKIGSQRQGALIKVSIPKQVTKGDRVAILTNPASITFYTEAGGQVGDAGIIRKKDGTMGANILNTYRVNNRIVHDCIIEGQVAIGDEVVIELDGTRKQNIARNHTATHLLHSALRKVLGSHVRQSGSFVNDTRLRFDFTHMKKLTERELERVEDLVNEKIKEAIPVKKVEMNREEAQREGAIALFGEKYQDMVRVVSISDYSKELCGGTHIDNTSEIGLFKIVRESSIASGMRRIEALTGERAKQWMEEMEKLKIKNEELKRESEEKKQLARERLKKAKEDIDIIIGESEIIKGVRVVTKEIDNANLEILRRLSDQIRTKEKSSLFITLAGKDGDMAYIVLSLTDDLVKKGLDAGLIVKEIAKVIGGSGGGRRDFAQAGGRGLAKINEALKKAKDLFIRSNI